VNPDDALKIKVVITTIARGNFQWVAVLKIGLGLQKAKAI
jgi:hypothetical protein